MFRCLDFTYDCHGVKSLHIDNSLIPIDCRSIDQYSPVLVSDDEHLMNMGLIAHTVTRRHETVSQMPVTVRSSLAGLQFVYLRRFLNRLSTRSRSFKTDPVCFAVPLSGAIPLAGDKVTRDCRRDTLARDWGTLSRMRAGLPWYPPWYLIPTYVVLVVVTELPTVCTGACSLGLWCGAQQPLAHLFHPTR